MIILGKEVLNTIVETLQEYIAAAADADARGKLIFTADIAVTTADSGFGDMDSSSRSVAGHFGRFDSSVPSGL